MVNLYTMNHECMSENIYMKDKIVNTKRPVYSARSAHVYSTYITHEERERRGMGGGDRWGGGGGQKGGVINIILERR